MPGSSDRRRFRNEDLVLKVSPSVNRKKWDDSRYELFLDELCNNREYQKEAIRTGLRYLIGGEYPNLRALAKANYEQNSILEERYGSWQAMQRHLQLPDHLSASLDLATGTGKSYVLYGIAAILLSEGIVDRVLVLCPSTTIEAGLMEKFSEMGGNSNLRDLLPGDAKISTPSIINGSESIVEGSICVENYHAILEHVGSSIRDSLWGKGHRTSVLNDEAHHVANESSTKMKRWKEFLVDPGYGFRYVIGVSGTCYVRDDYFSDVIYRYSLRQAWEEQFVKRVDYVAEMPKTADPDEKWQLIYNRHEETKKKLKKQKLVPLTIIVTSSISRCKDVADELRAFLKENGGIKPEEADERVLVVYNNAPDVFKLSHLDQPKNKVEWIVSVSMLNEGWDVKRVFQIVPHEERAFNSKLLIAQVLGRGLRIPNKWEGAPPDVIIFNHDAWAPRIKDLVNEVLDVERRVSSGVMGKSPNHFDLHNIEYTLEARSVKKPMLGEYNLFAKGFVDLAGDVATEEVTIEFERAGVGDRYKWQTKIQHKIYTTRQIAVEMYRRLEEAQDPDDLDPKLRTIYTDKYPLEFLEKMVEVSLARVSITVATDRVKQKFLQALGPLRRKESETIRYIPIAKRFFKITTRQRPDDSVSAAELRRDKVFFFTEQARGNVRDELLEFFDEVVEPGSGYRQIKVENAYDFKTPLYAAIADSENERRFIRALLDPQNLPHYDAWIKSTATRFYEIDYTWKKGEHPKRGKFSPDFFTKAKDLILVVEVKGDEELKDPSEENRKKYEFAIEHFGQVNKYLEEEGNPIRYKFNFLTERNFTTYFQYLRDGNIAGYRSELDVKLAEDS